MKINIIKQKNEIHVRIERPLYNNAKSSGSDYYPHAIKFGTPKVIRMLQAEGVDPGPVLKSAILDNRSEETRSATWIFKLTRSRTAQPAKKPKTPRRRISKPKATKKTKTEV